jgi:hypothetical protein
MPCQFFADNSKKIVVSLNKMDYRKAYDDLDYLNQISEQG